MLNNTNDTTKFVSVRMPINLHDRLLQSKPTALSKSAWLLWLLERQIAFEERKSNKPWKSPPTPTHTYTQPYQQDDNELIVEPFFD